MAVKNKTENPLPKTLPGAVCAQMVRCGKPSCKCARGELHGPYHYRFVWVMGRQHKVYVRQKDVDQVQAACENYRDENRNWRVEIASNKFSARSLRRKLVELEKQIEQLTGALATCQDQRPNLDEKRRNPNPSKTHKN